MASLLDNPLDRFFKGSPYLVRQGMGLAWARGARSRRWSLRTSCASAAHHRLPCSVLVPACNLAAAAQLHDCGPASACSQEPVLILKGSVVLLHRGCGAHLQHSGHAY